SNDVQPAIVVVSRDDGGALSEALVSAWRLRLADMDALAGQEDAGGGDLHDAADGWHRPHAHAPKQDTLRSLNPEARSLTTRACGQTAHPTHDPHDVADVGVSGTV
ncbi:hypothetical protein ACWCO3_09570, partial [Micromonospora sp. NPDC002411]